MNLPPGWTIPADWSLFVGSVGRLTIILAAICYLVAAFLPLLRSERAATFQIRIAGAAFVLLCTAFACLVTLFVRHQYHFQYIYNHSANDHPLQYLIAGVWSGQEGSFLLWATLSGVFAFALTRRFGEYRVLALSIFAFIQAALVAILAYESPFALIPEFEGRLISPPDGAGLAPSLMNYWVVIHPPTIFVGFGSLTLLFAVAVAALWKRDLVKWPAMLLPWSLFATGVLGLGLCMGGFWAYETLGWGGFWAWDPVENTSFVPWCFLVVLIHGLYLQMRRGIWPWVNVIMAAAPFLAFCYGTFLTRSGYLGDTSVHSFAQMDRSALQILIGIGLVAWIGFLGSLVFHWIKRKSVALPKPVLGGRKMQINRSDYISAGMWLTMAMMAVAAIGMSVPLIATLGGNEARVVEEATYHLVLGWMLPPFLLAMGLAPHVGWKNGKFSLLLRAINVPAAIAVGVAGWLLIWAKSGRWGVQADPQATVSMPFGTVMNAGVYITILAALCIFVAASAIARLIKIRSVKHAAVGGMIAHVGIALSLLGLIVSRGWEQTEDILIHPIEQNSAFGYSFEYIDTTSNFMDFNNKVRLNVTGPDGSFEVRPGLYFVPTNEEEPSPVIWPYIRRQPLYDLYITLYPMVFEATGETELEPGVTRSFQDLYITYKAMRSEGPMGMTGATFIVELAVGPPGEQEDMEAILTVTEDGLRSIPGRYRDTLEFHVERIDAASQNATIVVKYVHPAFPAEVFYKPLTILVWLGVGTMTFGLLLSAWARRPRSLPEKSADVESNEADPEVVDAP